MGLAFLGLVGVPAMIALYSDVFTSGAGLFPWFLCTNLVMVVVWVIGAPLLATGDRAIWLALDIVWACARWSAGMALLPVYGPTAVGIGMLLPVMLHMLLLTVVIRARYKLRLSLAQMAKVGIGIFVVVSVAVLGGQWTKLNCSYGDWSMYLGGLLVFAFDPPLSRPDSDRTFASIVAPLIRTPLGPRFGCEPAWRRNPLVASAYPLKP